MKQILADGFPVQVNDEDYETLNDFVWHLNKRNASLTYAYRWEKRINPTTKSKFKRISMHRQIMGFPKSTVDHEDGDGLNNQRYNLRPATQQQQAFNQHRRNGKKYKGVSPAGLIHHKWKPSKPFRVRIRVNGKLITLGWTYTEEEGAKLYNEAAKKYFGEFASLNVLPEEVAA